jgi:hypothetical protein
MTDRDGKIERAIGKLLLALPLASTKMEAPLANRDFFPRDLHGPCGAGGCAPLAEDRASAGRIGLAARYASD